MKAVVKYIEAHKGNCRTMILAEAEAAMVAVTMHNNADIESTYTTQVEQDIIMQTPPARIDIERYEEPDAVYHHLIDIHIIGHVEGSIWENKPVVLHGGISETVFGNSKVGVK